MAPAVYADRGRVSVMLSSARIDDSGAPPVSPRVPLNSLVEAEGVVRYFIVDAFAASSYRGNPAAVVPDAQGLSSLQRQHIASELNVSEVAFVTREGLSRRIEWRTPRRAAAFCGHATLAAAHVFHRHWGEASPVCFESPVGLLWVEVAADRYSLLLPRVEPLKEGVAPELSELFLTRADRAFETSDNFYLQLPHWVDVAAYEPDFAALERMGPKGICITARGDGSIDFVSRYFAPASGVPEDFVTGSTHAALAPYWARRLHKRRLIGKQLSKRSAVIECAVSSDTVTLWGDAITTAEGFIRVEPPISEIPAMEWRNLCAEAE